MVIRPADPIVLDTGPKQKKLLKLRKYSKQLLLTLSQLCKSNGMVGASEGRMVISIYRRQDRCCPWNDELSKTILEVIMKSSVFVFMTILVIYLFKLVLDGDITARSCGNDFEAALLKRRILGSLNISQQYKNAVKAASGESRLTQLDKVEWKHYERLEYASALTHVNR